MKLIKNYTNTLSQLSQWILILVVSGMLAPSALAVDTDNDGADDAEEGYAGTDINDPNERPYWWKTILGNNGGEKLGEAVAGLGDVNGDGYGDFVVGATSGSQSPTEYTKVTVYSGADLTELYSFDGLYTFDSNVLETLKLVNAGDVNNDGTNDFLFAEHVTDEDGGKVHVHSGIDGTELYLFDGADFGALINSQFGENVAAAGDVNNDGYDDLMIHVAGFQQNYAYGKTWVMSGADGTELYNYEGQLNDYIQTMSGIGDINADNYDDFVIVYSGGVRFYDGSNGSVIDTQNNLGSYVAALGDINGDTYPDIVFGDRYDSTNANSAGVLTAVSGVDRSVIYRVYGTRNLQRLGRDVRAAGDIDADGIEDFMSSSYNKQSKRTEVNIYSGAMGDLMHVLDYEPEPYSGSSFGYKFAGLGDIDGDGYGDVIAAAPTDHKVGVANGAVRIYRYIDLVDDNDKDFLVNSADTDDDNDGMSDVWENTYGLNPLVNDASGNLDGDSFTNLDEYNNGTNPLVYDVTVIANDVDADDDGDLILQDTGTSEVTIWSMQDAALSGSASQGQQSGYTAAGSGDIDRDDDVDLVFSDASGNVIVWIMQDGSKQSASWLGQWAGHAVVAIDDTDSDGDTDIITADAAGNVNVIDMEDGNKVAVRWIGQWAGRTVVGAGDADHDGDADIFMANGGDVMLIEMESGQKVSGRWLGVWSGRTVVGIGDADNDGDVDVYMENSGDIAIVELEDAAKVTARWLGVWATYSFKALADMDADGDKDMVLQDSGNGAIAAVEIENGVKVTGRWLGNHAYDVKGIADVDADSDDDIVMQDGSGNIALIEIQSGMSVAGATWLGINTGVLLLAD